MKSVDPYLSELGKLAAASRWREEPLSKSENERIRKLHNRLIAYRSKPAGERFWMNVRKGTDSECWLWIASKNTKGYGNFWFNGVCDKAHRVAYVLTSGKPIPKGIFCCHHCDNPSCVNPSHLFLGTLHDNIRDSLKKGRFVSSKRGETHTKAVFTNAQVFKIRELHATQRIGAHRQAKMLGCSKSAVQAILNRKTWKHI